MNVASIAISTVAIIINIAILISVWREDHQKPPVYRLPTNPRKDQAS